MKMTEMAFSTTDWSRIPVIEHSGDNGILAYPEFGDIRVRMVEYTPGYESDLGCSKGHVLLCLDGELETSLADGKSFVLKPGMSYHVGDGGPPHRSRTTSGAKLFIVD